MNTRALDLRGAFAFFLRKPTSRFMLLCLGTILGLRVWVGDLGSWDAVVAGSIILLWPFQEWILHVFVLHAKPIKIFGRSFDPLAGKSHREHHASPLDVDLSFMPMGVLLPYFGLHLGFWLLAMPSLGLALTGITTMLVFGLIYEWTHYLIHSAYHPRSDRYRRVWRSHRLHHFKNENYWYGVSMLAADHVLGTHARAEEVETSPTCLSLGQDSNLGV